MNQQNLFLIVVTLCSFFTIANPVFAQVTAFTCQGRLNDRANPANGIYDLSVGLSRVASGGAGWQHPYQHCHRSQQRPVQRRAGLWHPVFRLGSVVI